jgi:predicted PurR-regulated permease PerM
MTFTYLFLSFPSMTLKEILQRINQYLLFGALLVIVLYYGKTVLIPIVFAALLAMLMAPICRKLDSWGVHRALSSLVCILILLVTLTGVLAIVVAQVRSFSQDIPQIEEKTNELVSQVEKYIQDKFDVPPEKQESFFKEQIKSLGKSAGSYAGNIVSRVTSTIANLLLTLVYTFLFLYSKEKYETFFVKLYKEEEPAKVKAIVHQISEVSQQYLRGRVLSILVIMVMYSAGLLLIGIKNAILLAGIAALLTIIPYVGSVLGGLFPVLMALVTEDTVQPALWAGAVLIFIQAMDNYFIEPKIVGGEVNLSALATILILVIGGIIWGAVGMILFIPMLGVAKIVFDHVENLKPFGYLIGDPENRKQSRLKMWFKEKFGKGKSGSVKRKRVEVK